MSSSFTQRLITETKSHLWNDALHARELSRQTKNDWDRCTYARWALLTAWSVLEIAFRDALEIKDLNVPGTINDCLTKKGLPKIEWELGTWKRVIDLKTIRNKYTHAKISQDELFSDPDINNEAINVVRDAIKAIFTHVGKPAPLWIDMDSDNGWE